MSHPSYSKYHIGTNLDCFFFFLFSTLISLSCVWYFFLQRNPLTHKICLGESSVIEDRIEGDRSAPEWAGGGGGGGGATFIYHVRFMLSSFYFALSHHEHIPLEG